MKKQGRKIAVLVLKGRTEALRMSLGLTLASNQVSVFLFPASGGLEQSDITNIEALNEMGGLCYSIGSIRGPLCRHDIQMSGLGPALIAFDHVMVY